MKSIIEDTRQKENKHGTKQRQWNEKGIRFFRSKLIVGDYALPPSISIDTKQDISEIAGNMCGNSNERKRFLREIKVANDIGCKLIILIEDPRFHCIDDLFGKTVWIYSKPKRKIEGDQLAIAMITMAERYGVDFMFCDPDETAELIYKLLVEYDGTK